jgi:prepilin-type N-terminal cleavage/methylation domain-containing protein
MRERGFTLLEMLLSITIIGIMVGLSTPVYRSFLIRNDVDITLQSMANAIRRAQTYARGVSGDSVWSIEVQASTITLFKGTVFASRDTNYDEVVSIPDNVTASGLSEVQFTKFTGKPNTSGNIVLTTTTTGETKTLTINTEGMVNYP